MKIAVFSDIHGNCCALDAVLDDASRRDVDSFVCLGDVAATGPQPLDALERVVALGCPVVMGNADDILLGAETPETDDEFMSRIYDIDSWCAGLLDDSHREHVRGYAPTVSLADGAFLGFHGSPASFDEVIAPDASEDHLARAVGGDAVVNCGGHTHFQTFRRFGDRFYINPGSVGMSYDRISGDVHLVPVAEYATVEVGGGELRGVDLHRLPYDPDPLFRFARASGMPHIEWWLGEWAT